MFLRVCAVIMALFFTTSGAFAEFIGPGSGSESETTVKQVLDNPVNNMWVTIKGKILKKTGYEKYVFSDGTGEITVNIEDGCFPFNRPVTPQTIIKISGEVDSSFIRREIDVRQIIIIGDTNTPPQQEKPKGK